MHRWFMFGLGLSLSVTMMIAIVLTLLGTVFRRSLHRSGRSRHYAIIGVLLLILVIKLVYYFGWVTDGLVIYYNDLVEEEISLTIYRSALGYFTIFNILDIVRNLVVFSIILACHLRFKREAFRERLRLEALHSSNDQAINE